MFHLSVSPQGVGADPHLALALPPESKLMKEKVEEPSFPLLDSDEMTIRIGRAGPHSGKPPFIYPHHKTFQASTAGAIVVLMRKSAI